MRKEKWEENNQKGADNMVCIKLPHVQDTTSFFLLSFIFHLLLLPPSTLFRPDTSLYVSHTFCDCTFYCPLLTHLPFHPLTLSYSISGWWHLTTHLSFKSLIPLYAVLSSCNPWIPVFLLIFFFCPFSLLSLL